jgi:fibronectin type 3 domain-containing protein
LTWGAVGGATSYVVSRGDTAGAATSQIATPTATSFTDSGLGQGVTKFYTVHAVGAGGASGESAAVSGTTAVEPVPGNVLATAGLQQISLTWDAVPGATQYEIRRSDTSGGIKGLAGSTAGSSFVDQGLTQLVTRFYVVRAIGPAGTGLDSAEVAATTLAEPVPQNLVATGGAGQIALTWDAVANATSYVVFRGTIAGGAKTQIGTPTSNGFADSGLNTGAARFYVVRAVSGSDTSADSTEANATTDGPGAPAGLSAAPANGRVTLSWSVATGAAGYQVLRSSNGSAEAPVGETSATTLIDSTVANGATYQYAVRSTAAVGASDESAQVAARPFRALCATEAQRNQVVVFDGDAPANSPPLRIFGSLLGRPPVAIAVNPGRKEIYSVDGWVGSVRTQSELVGGNLAPSRTLNVPTPAGIAYDADDDELLVVAFLSEIWAFNPLDQGDAQPARRIALGLGGNPNQMVYTGKANGDRLLLIDLDNNIISVPRAASGSVHPDVIATPGLAGVTAIAYDPTADEVLVAGYDSSAVFMFESFSVTHPAAAPTRVLRGDVGGFFDIRSLAVDPTGGLLYASTGSGRVEVYPLAFTTATSGPLAELSGTSTELSFGKTMLAFDGGNGTLVAQSDDRTLVFDRSATGDTNPLVVLSADDTGIDDPLALAFDPDRGELVVINEGITHGATVYSGTASGDTAPTRTLATLPGQGGGIFSVAGVAIDATHDETMIATNGFQEVSIYPRSASAASPSRVIQGPATLLTSARSVALDTANDAIVVADYSAIRRYARSFTDGDEAPLTSITGPTTGLQYPPDAIFVDNADGEIFVAQPGSVLVFRLTDDGDVAPLRVLLLNVSGILVDSVANEMFVTTQGAVMVYSRTASGSDLPLRIVRDESADFQFLSSVAICN